MYTYMYPCELMAWIFGAWSRSAACRPRGVPLPRPDQCKAPKGNGKGATESKNPRAY